MRGTVLSGTYSIDELEGVEVKGTLPESGSITIVNGEVANYTFHYTDYDVTYDDEVQIVTKIGSSQSSTPSITTLSSTTWRMNDIITGYNEIFPVYDLSGDITDCTEFGKFTMTGYVNNQSVGSNTSYALAVAVYYGVSVFVEFVGHNEAYFVYIPENNINYPPGWYYGQYSDLRGGGLSSLAKADYIEISFDSESNLDGDYYIGNLATTKSNLKSSTYINWFLENATQK